MRTLEQVLPAWRASHAHPAKRLPLPAVLPSRSAAVMIADLLRRRVAPTRSREEQQFIDLQHGCSP